MADSQKTKLSEKKYLEDGGISCPFCEESGGVEGDHDFEIASNEARMNAGCSECGESYVEVYEFSYWQSGGNSIGKDMGECPHCKTDISEESVEYLEIDGPGTVAGTLVCPECEEKLQAVFVLSGWD